MKPQSKYKFPYISIDSINITSFTTKLSSKACHYPNAQHNTLLPHRPRNQTPVLPTQHTVSKKQFFCFQKQENTSKIVKTNTEKQKTNLSAESWTTSAAENRGSDSHWCKLDPIFFNIHKRQ